MPLPLPDAQISGAPARSAAGTASATARSHADWSGGGYQTLTSCQHTASRPVDRRLCAAVEVGTQAERYHVPQATNWLRRVLTARLLVCKRVADERMLLVGTVPGWERSLFALGT